ncbi:hypothetical protein [Kitasatospora sp. KL5]|uniref:hypothetical protein n=1 Tax=Kitasatospora sp. KL5 TaxID=3425125 RepID=UPI003D6DD815
MNLATSLTFTLSYMLPAMAQAQARQPEEVLAQLVGELRASGGNPDVVRVVEQLDSLTGSAAVLAEIMGTDQVAFLGLVLELADFTAQASVLAARVLDCPLEEVWEEVDAGLRT